jgi:hypothetical protein
MTTPKDAALSIRLNSEDREALEQIAEANDEPIAQTARRAIRAFIAAAGVLIAVLGLSACGGADEPSVTDQTPVAQVEQPTAETGQTAKSERDCWSVSQEWIDSFNAVGTDPARVVAMIDDLPAPSAGCKKADREFIERRLQQRSDILAATSG